MLHSILAAALLAAFPQDKAPAKTVEERLKELEEKLTTLEKRHQTLEGENQALEKKIVDAKAARQAYVKQVAAGWVQRYSKPAEFTEKQSAEFEELWTTWTTGDFEKPVDAAAWKSREETIKARLSAEQVRKLTGTVRDESEKMAKMMIAGIAQQTKISSEHAGPFEKAVLAKMSLPEDVVLTQAHPEQLSAWFGVYGLVEKLLPDLGSVLGEEEIARVRDLLTKIKPRR